MIKIDNFTSQNSKKLVEEYNLILKDEESKENNLNIFKKLISKDFFK